MLLLMMIKLIKVFTWSLQTCGWSHLWNFIVMCFSFTAYAHIFIVGAVVPPPLTMSTVQQRALAPFTFHLIQQDQPCTLPIHPIWSHLSTPSVGQIAVLQQQIRQLNKNTYTVIDSWFHVTKRSQIKLENI